MRLLAKTGTIFDYIINFFAVLAGVCAFSIMLVMCYEVIMRYFLNQPPAWAVEISEYLIYFIAFGGATWLLREEGHVRVDLVLGLLSPKHQILLNIVTSIMGAIICLILTWYGIESTVDHVQRDIFLMKSIMMPKAPLLAVIPLFSFLLSIQFLRQACGHLSRWRMQGNEDQKPQESE